MQFAIKILTLEKSRLVKKRGKDVIKSLETKDYLTFEEHRLYLQKNKLIEELTEAIRILKRN